MNYDAVMSRESDGKISAMALRIPSTQTVAEFLDYEGDVSNPATIADAIMIWRMYRYSRTPAPPRVLSKLQGVAVNQEVRRVYSALPIADKRDRAVEFARQYDIAMDLAAAPTNATESATDRLARCVARCKLSEVNTKALNDDIGKNAGIPMGGRVVFGEVSPEEYQTLLSQNAVAVRNLDQMEQRTGVRIAQLRTRLQDSERRTAVVEQQLSDERRTTQGLRTDVARLNTDVTTLTANLQGANNQVTTLTADLQGANNRNAELERRTAELEATRTVTENPTHVTPRSSRSRGES